VVDVADFEQIGSTCNVENWKWLGRR